MLKKTLRDKVYRWLLQLKNSTDTSSGVEELILQRRDIESNINVYNEYIASKMFQQNATKYFESKNISISDLNITQEHMNDFLEKLMELSKPINGLNESHHDVSSSLDETCNYKCNGFFRDILLAYKGMHGYISLVVRIMIYKDLLQIHIYRYVRTL